MWWIVRDYLSPIFVFAFSVLALIWIFWIVIAVIWSIIAIVERVSAREFVPSGKKTVMFVAFVIIGMPIGAIIYDLYGKMCSGNNKLEKQNAILKEQVDSLKREISTSSTDKESEFADDTTVYICTGESATKYHCNEDCAGLSGCSGEIEEISEDEAIDMGRTQCHICY